MLSPESSRAYLLKSFPIHNDTTRSTNVSLKQSASASASPAEKERCLSLLLRAIDLLCESWASTLAVPRKNWTGVYGPGIYALGLMSRLEWLVGARKGRGRYLIQT